MWFHFIFCFHERLEACKKVYLLNAQENEDESNTYLAGEQDASLNKGLNVNVVAEEVKCLTEMEEQPAKCRQVSFHCPEPC